jgi:hypothetical protein
VQQVPTAVQEHFLADIEGPVDGLVSRRGTLVKQVPGLARGATAELDDMRRAQALDEIGGTIQQQGILGTGHVVFGGVADGIEQLRAALIIEVFRRQRTRRFQQALLHILHQARQDPGRPHGPAGQAGMRLCAILYHRGLLSPSRGKKIPGAW